MSVSDAVPAALPLSDGVVDLRLIRVIGPEEADARPANAQFMATAPEHRFAIHRVEDGVRVGRIHLRITSDPVVLRAVGHLGYAVDDAHQRRGYATRAVRLIRRLAAQHDVGPLWVLIAPDNVASRRTVERAGFTLVDIVEASAEALGMGVAPVVCRYMAQGSTLRDV
ncbi:MAG: GNAT family N-acetyltransferase [Gemmatimonadota bacterium]